MIPEERFSTETVKGQLYNPWIRQPNISKHWGPVALQDPSQGLGVKLWQLRTVDDGIMLLSAPAVPEFEWYTHGEKLTQVSLAFDQNGRPVVAFVTESGSAFLRWFDPLPSDVINFNISSFATTPRVTLDDDRPFNIPSSDVILGYVRAGFVRYRRQRDRFTVEYTPTIGASGGSPIIPVLSNPGFDSSATDYDLQTVGGAVLSWSATGGRTSPGCVRMIATGSGEFRDGVVVTDQQLPIPYVGARIGASVYGKMQQGTYGTSFRVQLRWFDASHNYISDFIGPERSRGLVGTLWVSSTSGLRLPPSNARFFEVAALLNGSSVGTQEFFIDDFSITTDAGGGGGGGGGLGQPAPATALRHISMNSNMRLEFLTDDAGDEPWSLAEVVEDLCVRGDVPAENVDVRDLWDDPVPGFPVTADDGFDKPIKELMDVYQFDKSQFDRRLNFPKRGRAIAAWIPYKDLVPKSPATLEMIYVDEQDLPRDVVVNHLDPDAGHSGNFQRAFRRSNQVHTEKTEKIDTKVVMTAGQAVTVAWRKLKERWAELITFKFTTTLRYTRLTPADVVMVQDSEGEWHRVRLEDRNEDTGNIDWEAKLDAGEQAYSMSAAALASQTAPPTSTTPGQVSETHIEIVNVSPLLDQNDQLGLYVGAAGTPGLLWRGYQLGISVDGGNTYADVASGSAPSIIGESVSDLPSEVGHDINSVEEVEVLVNFPLSSASPAQLDTGTNRFVIGDELAQFEDAALLGMDGPMYHYVLSGLRRAKYGTPADAWPAGTRFMFIDETVVFIQVQQALIGTDIDVKPVSVGQNPDSAIATLYLFDEPWSQTEWKLDTVTTSRNAFTQGAVVSVVPRPRLGQFGTTFHSQHFAGYRYTFSDGHQITTQDTEVHYAAAPATGLSVTVYPLNAITGAGPGTGNAIPDGTVVSGDRLSIGGDRPVAMSGFNANDTTFPVSTIPLVTADDMLFAYMVSTVAVSAQVGWTLVETITTDGGSPRIISVFQKDTVTAGDTGTTVAWATGSNSLNSMGYLVVSTTGATAGTLEESDSVKSSYASSTAFPHTIDIPAVTSDKDGSLAVAFALVHGGGVTEFTSPLFDVTGGADWIQVAVCNINDTLTSEGEAQFRAVNIPPPSPSAGTGYYAAVTLRLAP